MDSGEGERIRRLGVYSPETIAEWEEEAAERFGDDWPAVQRIRATLAGMGIFYYDAHPGNIRFR